MVRMLLHTPTMQPITLNFNDRALELKYCYREFDRKAIPQIAWWGILFMLTFVTGSMQTLWRDNWHSLVWAVVFLAGAVIRTYLYLNPQPWRMRGWTLSCYSLTLAASAIEFVHGSPLNSLASASSEVGGSEDWQIAVIVVMHTLIFVVVNVSVWTETAYHFGEKVLVSLYIGISTIFVFGFPPAESGQLDRSVAALTCTLGTVLGVVLGHASEYYSREAFMKENVWRDTMMVWRAAAITMETQNQQQRTIPIAS